jgi:hypothetical protein
MKSIGGTSVWEGRKWEFRGERFAGEKALFNKELPGIAEKEVEVAHGSRARFYDLLSKYGTPNHNTEVCWEE